MVESKRDTSSSRDRRNRGVDSVKQENKRWIGLCCAVARGALFDEASRGRMVAGESRKKGETEKKWKTSRQYLYPIQTCPSPTFQQP